MINKTTSRARAARPGGRVKTTHKTLHFFEANKVITFDPGIDPWQRMKKPLHTTNKYDEGFQITRPKTTCPQVDIWAWFGHLVRRLLLLHTLPIFKLKISIYILIILGVVFKTSVLIHVYYMETYHFICSNCTYVQLHYLRIWCVTRYSRLSHINTERVRTFVCRVIRL